MSESDEHSTDEHTIGDRGDSDPADRPDVDVAHLQAPDVDVSEVHREVAVGSGTGEASPEPEPPD